MIRNTTTDYTPWYVVPADHKWFTLGSCGRGDRRARIGESPESRNRRQYSARNSLAAKKALLASRLPKIQLNRPKNEPLQPQGPPCLGDVWETDKTYFSLTKL
jgi:hypothetical protein